MSAPFLTDDNCGTFQQRGKDDASPQTQIEHSPPALARFSALPAGISCCALQLHYGRSSQGTLGEEKTPHPVCLRFWRVSDPKLSFRAAMPRSRDSPQPDQIWKSVLRRPFTLAAGNASTASLNEVPNPSRRALRNNSSSPLSCFCVSFTDKNSALCSWG